jgi:DNA-directed RNA polymerase specialized sigma24 family protein
MHTTSDGQFPTTSWSLVMQIRSSDEVIVRKALESICRDYWPPLYRFVRLQGASAEQAEDEVQGFFAKMLEKGWLESIETPGQSGTPGSLRAFLLSCFKAYRANEYRRENAQRRGGAFQRVHAEFDSSDTDLMDLQPSTGRSPDDEYDRAWAMEVLNRATHSLRQRYIAKGRADQFTALEPYLMEGSGEPQTAIAERLGSSPAKLKTDIHRLRQRFRESIREEVARTLAPDAGVSVDEELAHLIRCLG